MLKSIFYFTFQMIDFNFIACLRVAHFTKPKNYLFLTWIFMLI